MMAVGSKVTYVPARSALSPAVFTIGAIHPNSENPERSSVDLAVTGLPDDAPRTEKGETLVVEASIKPYINLVWMGTVTVVAGLALTLVRRLREARSAGGQSPPVTL